MQNITIGRYRDNDFAGWIEGVRDDGSRWVMFIDAQGSPQTFWAHREPDGAVIGPAIDLEP